MSWGEGQGLDPLDHRLAKVLLTPGSSNSTNADVEVPCKAKGVRKGSRSPGLHLSNTPRDSQARSGLRALGQILNEMGHPAESGSHCNT